ncbi:vascular cell adhesion protein 1-like [Paramormyrops kingsleyae]|uniref:vascular cell adhesion protein 1-like n=1 Tax=Paramormyrops kingsleyae TaxID=1676925 RepID=UPI003B97C254
MRSTQGSVLWLILAIGVAADGCLELHPPRVVVRHGDLVSVNCTVSTDHSAMGWTAPVDDVPITPGVQFLTWRVESLRIWDLMPLCYANRPGKPQCKERLSVTVYKPPDSVSVSSMDSTDSMVEGSQYQLKCEIQNIAPVQSLTVKWYKGDKLVHEDRDYVTEDGKSDREKEPVSVSSTLLITANRTDDKVQYTCEAELDLGPEGPQPPLAVKSTPLRVTVHYSPYFLGAKTETYSVYKGDEVRLPCTAEGNPPPVYAWSTPGSLEKHHNGSVFISSTLLPGTYTCTASNRLGEDSKQFVIQHKPSAADGCLELHPPRVVVRHGDPVSVNCTVSTDHSGMGWAAPVDDVPITPGVQFLTWRVESLRIWYLRPLCFANRPGKPQCKERLSVTVYKPPDSVSVSSMDSTDSMVEGSQYQLKCEIQNIAPVQNLTVKWYKGDTLVHEDRDYVTEDRKSDREKEPVSVSSTLLITPSRADDKVQYTCEAELDLGPEGPQPPLAVKSTPLRVTVHYSPYFLGAKTVTYSVYKGDEVRLPCTAEGNPPPVYAWSTPGSLEKHHDGSVFISSTLLPGTYTCTASNRLGEDSKQFVIQHKPSAADGCLELHPPRVVVRHGDPVSVNCTVSTDHSGMGWAAPVDEVPITPGVQFLTWRVESLTIWDLKPLCYANRPGKAQCKERLSVTVYKLPDSVSVSSVNSTDSMVEGSQYQLKCEIQNIAPVQNLTVKWYKGDTLVHEDRDYVIEDKKPVSVSSTLLITANRTDDKVQYTCEAELDLGPEGPQPPLAVKSTPLSITVHYSPYFLGAKTVTVYKGDEVRLTCTAEGNPPPVYAWSTPGSLEKHHNGSVFISSTLLPGTYTCTASNRLGEDSKQFIIEHKPSDNTIYIIITLGLLVPVVLIITCSVLMWKSRQTH